MLETYFKYPGVLKRMRQGPLAGRMDRLADELERVGYKRSTARCYLSLASKFSRYAAEAGCATVEAIDAGLVSSFLSMSSCEATKIQVRTALGHALPDLTRGVAAGIVLDDGADTAILASFQWYLLNVRGLQPRSIAEILLLARRMLHWRRARDKHWSVANLNAEDVLAFVAHLTGTCRAPGTRSAAVSYLRSWLRYLHGHGTVSIDLARLVPRVPCWRLAKIPGYLDWDSVRAVIDAIDPATPTGERDRALLLILATTGLRSQEVRLLEIRDIDWMAARLHIRTTKSRHDRFVPLLAEAGTALAAYLLNSRPRNVGPVIFLRHVPPVGPLPYSSSLAAIVRRRLAARGMRPAMAGAHLFRHSFATRLVQQGQPVKEVADILGHRSIDTTAIYVKVALPQLAEVALPFPGVRHE